ncbi:hypothetical protein [Actinomadura macra]|uniref:hypothetical protein n=1 Tax=Actinomadura macra TaxID=46164 RepID=UPI0012F8E6B4|nr:hypothetical protein [Actinomadura macra]
MTWPVLLVTVLALAISGPQTASAAARRGHAAPTLNQTVLMVWKGVSGDERVWWNQRQNGQWSTSQKISDAAIGFGPALGLRQYDLRGVEPVMLWKGVEGDQRIRWSSLNGGSWSGPEVVPGASSSFRLALGSAYIS